MEKVSMLELRRHAEAIIRKAQQGKRMLLTYRGKPVMRLEPLQKASRSEDDPFYSLDRFAVTGGKPLSNDEIDRIVYDA
jgi:antitoxin (DNA-binding transcriptional repressor) of toxin-antitoxin stability system